MNSNLKGVLIGSYLVIGFFYAIYQHFWGMASYKGLAYNIGQGYLQSSGRSSADIGQGLGWPFSMFPTFGKFVGGILLLLFLVFVALKPKS